MYEAWLSLASLSRRQSSVDDWMMPVYSCEMGRDFRRVFGDGREWDGDGMLGRGGGKCGL